MGTPARLAVLLLLATASVFVGVGDVSPARLLDPSAGQALHLLLVSRIPRTLALILAGTGLAVAGLIMQMLVRNRFVEPSTAGTVDSAGLGMLAVTLLAPGAPVIVKMVAAAAAALAGTVLFLAILRRMPVHSVLTVPLVGIMLGGVIGSVSTFIAYRFDLLQTLGTWTNGDFSTVLRGRYELLWIVAILTLVAYAVADRLSVAGLGRDVAVNLGLDHRKVVGMGLAIVATVTAATVATVGIIPFLGLVVPNIVSLVRGDNLRRTLPDVAALGAGLVLLCDIAGRLLRYPFEIPVGTVMGVVGSAVFLALLLRRGARLG